MPISIERQADLMTLTVTGEVTAEALYRGVDAIYENEAALPKMVLWDMTDTDPPTAGDSAEQLRDFSIYTTDRGKSRAGARVAVVSPEDAQFGMARMSASLAEVNQAAYSMRIFRDSASAMAWLTEAEGEL